LINSKVFKLAIAIQWRFSWLFKHPYLLWHPELGLGGGGAEGALTPASEKLGA